MGTREFWECDWCGAIEGKEDVVRLTWRDPTGELLCPVCWRARDRAIDAAKAQRSPPAKSDQGGVVTHEATVSEGEGEKR